METAVDGSNTRHPFCLERSPQVHSKERKLKMGLLQATASDSELSNPLDMLFMSCSQLEAHDKTIIEKNSRNIARHPAGLDHKEESQKVPSGDDVVNAEHHVGNEGGNANPSDSSSGGETNKQADVTSGSDLMCTEPKQSVPTLTVFQYPSDTQITRRSRRRKCQRRYTAKKARVSTSASLTRKPRKVVGSVLLPVKPSIACALSAGQKELMGDNAPCLLRVSGTEDCDAMEEDRPTCMSAESCKDVQVAGLGTVIETKLEMAPASGAGKPECTNGSLLSPPPLPQPTTTTSSSTSSITVTSSIPSASVLKRTRRQPGLSKSFPGKKLKMAVVSGEPASSTSVSEPFSTNDKSPEASKMSLAVFEFESAALATSTPLICRGQSSFKVAEPVRKLPVKSFKAPRKLSDVSQEEEQASVARILARFGCPTPKKSVKASGSGSHQSLADSGFVGAGSCKLNALDEPGESAGLKEPLSGECSEGLANRQGIVATGFSTAGGRSLTVSRAAMDRGKLLLGESALSPPCDVTPITNFDVMRKEELKNVSLAEPKKARKWSFEGELGDRQTNLPTAGNIAELTSNVTDAHGNTTFSVECNHAHRSEGVAFAAEFKETASKKARVVTGFSTASGRDILVSTSALKRATGMVNEEEEASKKTRVVTGFSTASGRDILVSNSALEKVKGIVNEDEKVSKKRNAITGFSTASGREILVSASALQRATSMVSKEEEASKKTRVMTGFSKASGRDICVSSSALEKVTGVVHKEEEASKKSRVVTGFSTASGRDILVSTSSLERATGIVNEEQALVASGGEAVVVGTVFSGFTTASGKSLNVSSNSLRKAQELVSNDLLAASEFVGRNQTTTQFSTASGKGIEVRAAIFPLQAEDTDLQHIPQDLDIEKFSTFTQLPAGTSLEGVYDYHEEEEEDRCYGVRDLNMQTAADVDSPKLLTEKEKVVSKEAVPSDTDMTPCQALPVASEQDSFGLDALFEFNEQIPPLLCPPSYYDQDTHTVLDLLMSESHSEDKACSSEPCDKGQIGDVVREEVHSCDTVVCDAESLSASIIANLENTGLFAVSDDSRSSGDFIHTDHNDCRAKKDNNAANDGHQSDTGSPPILVASESVKSKPAANDSIVSTSPAENSTFSSYSGLATASGKSVSVSAQSLAHVRRVLHDDIPCVSQSTESVDHTPIHTTDKDAHSRSFPLVGLSTASGKGVAISEEALAHVRTQRYSENWEQPLVGMGAGCGKGGDPSWGALADSRDEFSGDHPASVSHPMASLSTASGKTVTVSEELLALVKGTVWDADHACQQAGFPALGFSTASGRPVSVSQTALEHAKRKLLSETQVHHASVIESTSVAAISTIKETCSGGAPTPPSRALSAGLADISRESVPLCEQRKSEASNVNVTDCPSLKNAKKDTTARGKKTLY